MDDKYLSSPEEFRQFMQGSVYRDFLMELDIRIKELTNVLIDEEMNQSSRMYDICRGGIKNMKQMKDIFTDMAFNSEADIRHKEK